MGFSDAGLSAGAISGYGTGALPHRADTRTYRSASSDFIATDCPAGTDRAGGIHAIVAPDKVDGGVGVNRACGLTQEVIKGIPIGSCKGN
jgi:hypothetical protein